MRSHRSGEAMRPRRGARGIFFGTLAIVSIPRPHARRLVHAWRFPRAADEVGMAAGARAGAPSPSRTPTKTDKHRHLPTFADISHGPYRHRTDITPTKCRGRCPHASGAARP